MKRIALGVVTGLSVWFASALAAEAQQITPTGPLVIHAGDVSATFTATITLSAPSFFYVKINVYQNGICLNSSTTLVPNPGTTTYNFHKLILFNAAAQAGCVIDFQSAIVCAGQMYVAPDWNVTVSGTRPSKPTTVQPSSKIAVQAIDRDRRRE